MTRVTTEEGGLIIEATTDPDTATRYTSISMKTGNGDVLRMSFNAVEAALIRNKLSDVISWQIRMTQ